MKDFKQEYCDALEIAMEVHDGQQDKGGHPYVLHPIRVSQRCKSDEAKVAALLHDVVEDSDYEISYIRSFGISNEDILSAVDALTRRKNESYSNYIDRVSKNPIALEVKIADLEDNMDITRLDTLTDDDIKRLKKYHSYYKKLKCL